MLAMQRQVEIVLSSDQEGGGPVAGAPTFICWMMTGKERRAFTLALQVAAQINQKAANELNSENVEALEKALAEVLGQGLAGWRNIRGRDGKDVAFPAKGGEEAGALLLSMLTMDETWELIVEMRAKTRLTPEDKKKLPSGSDSPGPETTAGTSPAVIAVGGETNLPSA